MACHNGDRDDILNFRRAEKIVYEGKSMTDELFFDESGYLGVHPYVFRPGPDSDNAVIVPMEYHASVSDLIQLFQRGHHNVELSTNEWEALYNWIV